LPDVEPPNGSRCASATGTGAMIAPDMMGFLAAVVCHDIIDPAAELAA
jgi:hypothetical protein